MIDAFIFPTQVKLAAEVPCHASVSRKAFELEVFSDST